MKKIIPYLVVLIAIISGLLLKDKMDGSIAKTETNEESNKIDNSYTSFLIYPKKNQLSSFVLTDQFGNAFNQENFEGSWNLIFMGYTNCPDVCPNTLNQLNQLYTAFSEPLQQKIRIVFIAVDPERDTPKHLSQYLSFFNDEFIGITGDKKQLDGLVRNLGGIYSINKDEGEFYTVDHSARIFIVDNKARRFGIIDDHALNKNTRPNLVKELTDLIEKS